MNIGLIACNAKKELMTNFCIAYRHILSGNTIFATGTTGIKIEKETDLSVRKFLPGYLGGDRQMVAEIECNNIDAVIYMHDTGDDSEDRESFSMILRLCDVNNIPIATNLASAELLINAIGRGDLDWRTLYK